MTSTRAPLWVAMAALLVGAVFLRDLASDPSADPTVSVDNGAPAGLLAMRLLLEERRREVLLWRDFEDERPPLRPGSTYVVPPPSRAAWTEAEADDLVERVLGGERLLLLCDEQDAALSRQRELLRRFDVYCRASPSSSDAIARGTTPFFAGQVRVRGQGRASPLGTAPAVPLVIDGGGAAVVLGLSKGNGAVFAVASSTLFANDGLLVDDNAALLLALLGEGGAVVFDERHHGVRGQGAMRRAFSRTGPQVAMFALLLLVPAVLLGLAPRRGDPPAPVPSDGLATTGARLERLAALYERVGGPSGAPLPLDPSALHRGASRHERNPFS
ncbi:MAG: DUF4350 domain-containing protein [Myxococcota bacterium]